MKKYALVLAICLGSFFVYNLSYNRIVKGDTTGARILPFLLLSGRGIYFDDIAPYYKEFPYFFQKTDDGHIISGYPLLPGIVSIPVYLPFYAYLRINNIDTPEEFLRISPLLEKLSASLFAAVSVGLFFLLLQHLRFSRRWRIGLSLVFAFATQTFSISSQYLWQHGIANLFLVLSLLFLVKGVASSSRTLGLFVVSILFSLLSVYTRYSFIVFYLLIVSTCVWVHTKRRYIYIGLGIVGLLSFFYTNAVIYGSFVGTKVTPLTDFSFLHAVNGIVGILLSPARGIVWYTPFFVFSMLSIVYWKQLKSRTKVERILYCISWVYLLWIIVVHGAWGFWWGGWGWGDRYLADAAIPAVLLFYYFYIFTTSTILRIIAIACVVLSIFLQIIGVFYYPRAQWDNYPVNVEKHLERLWDVRDTPISRALVVGPDVSGFIQWTYIVHGIFQRSYTGIERRCSLMLINKSSRFGYNTVEVAFANKSAVDWVTAGVSELQIRQFYPVDDAKSIESPLPSSALPSVIKSGDTVYVPIVLIPPPEATGRVILIPIQENVGWWDKSCSLEITYE